MNIRKVIYILAIILIVHLVPTACSQAPDNGNLDGLWHLRTVENLADGTLRDVKEERVYYAIQLRLVSLRRADRYNSLIGRSDHNDGSLILHSFVILDKEDQQATETDLKHYYLEGTTSKFEIVELNKKTMILRSDTQELCFRKF